jgi:hypothetical protein
MVPVRYNSLVPGLLEDTGLMSVSHTREVTTRGLWLRFWVR